jgi:hypothetical protein
MSLWKRILDWRRTKAEDRATIATAEEEKLRVGDEPQEAPADAEQDITDAGSGKGATL